jgi:hypothetical protein
MAMLWLDSPTTLDISARRLSVWLARQCAIDRQSKPDSEGKFHLALADGPSKDL